jgi:rare lipoprotein A (peptidoglycan hydrolase)
MRYRLTIACALVAALALVAAGPGTTSARAEPLAEQVAVDRAALDRAIASYESAQQSAADTGAKVAEATAALDAAIAEQQRCEAYLRTRVSSLYRTGEGGILMLLLGAESLPELSERLDLLTRMAEQDARTVRDLKSARNLVEGTARGLLDSQAEQAEALEALEAEVTRARAEFAASEAALKEYEQRQAAAAKAAREAAAQAKTPAPASPTPPQDATGDGEWQTAVASHYSRTFTGRGASGKPIGPYTMMVAHKTLPFGTLVEFEYRGKRAVASVEDRGPYTPGRVWDLGPGVVRALDFNGVHEVRYRIVSR